MKTLIVYDTYFSNTEQIAQAIKEVLTSFGDVEVVKVSDIKSEQLNGLNLLIVGSPTRGFRPTKAISSFLKTIPLKTLDGVKVLSFDTRVSLIDVNNRLLNILVKMFGYAAEPIANQLKKKGGNLAAASEGFFVKGNEGPLKDGELERAKNWVKKLFEA